MSFKHKTHQDTLPTLTGLRGVACLMVMVKHCMHAGWGAFMPSESGTFGVWIFFTLSGFLMSYHYLPGKGTLRYWAKFLIRRVFRVYPLFFLLTLIIWVGRQYNWHIVDFDNMNWDVLKSHWFLQSGQGILWTIPVEMKFYGLFSLIGISMFILRIPVKFMPLAWTAIWLISVIATGSRMYMYDPITALMPHLPFFVAGTAAGYFSKTIKNHEQKNHFIWNVASVLYAIIIILLIYLQPIDVLNMSPYLEWEYIWFKSFIMAALILAFAQSSGVVQWIFGNQVALFLGKISFSLYLVHHFVFYISRDFIPQTAFNARGIYLLTFFLSYLSYHLIEKPFHNYGKRIAAKL